MDVLQRQMFKMPQQNESMGGITSGLDEAEAVESTEALGGIASGIETLFQNIDNAENPKEIMDAIRGDEASVEDRRTELGQLVGKADADKTPESVLTIVQPLMTVIESTGGIASIDSEESPVAQNIGEDKQMEAMAKMMQNEPTAMLSIGTGQDGNPTSMTGGFDALNQSYGTPLGVLQLAQRLAPKAPTLESFQKQYQDKPSAYEDYGKILPYTQLAKLGQIVGSSPTLFDAFVNPETAKLADPLMQLSLLKAKEDQTRETKATDKFIEAKKSADAQQGKLYSSILPKLLDQKFTYRDLPDGTVLQLDPQGKPTVFQEGDAPTITLGDTLLKLNRKTDKYEVAYSKPGANIKMYSTDKGQFAIDFSKKVNGGYATVPLAGGLTQGEIDSKFFKYIDTGDGGGFALDTRKPVIEGKDGSMVPNYLFQKQGKDKTTTQQTQAGVFVVNESNPEKSFLIPDTAKKEFIKVGNKETGFRMIDKFTGVGFNVPGLKEFQPEFEKKLQAFTDASKVINNPDNFSPAKVNEAKLRYSALSNELLPASTEFEKLRDDNAKIFRKTLSESAGIDGDSADIDRQVEQFVFNLTNDRIEKLTTNASAYDTQKSLKDTYAKMLGKLQVDTADRATKSESLAKLGKLQSLVSDSTRTGATAPFRLAVGKLLEDLGVKDSVIGKLGIDAKSYDDFIGGKLANLELASKIGSQFAVEFASSFPGNLNQSEVDLIQNAGINLTTTKDGIKVMEEIFKGAAERDKQEQTIINNYMSNTANNNKTPMKQYSDIQSLLIKNRADNPLVTPEITEKIKGFTDEKEMMFQVGGGDSSQSFIVTPDRQKKFNLVQASGAETFDEFLARSGPMQDYAKEISGNDKANFSKDQLKQIFNLYKPLTLVRNPNFKAN